MARGRYDDTELQERANREADTVFAVAARVRNMLAYGQSDEEIRAELHASGVSDETARLAIRVAKLAQKWDLR